MLDQFSWPRSFQNAGWTTIPLLTHTLLPTHILALPTSPYSYHTVNKEASLIPIHHAQPVVLDKQTVSTTSLELDADYIQKSYPKSCLGKHQLMCLAPRPYANSSFYLGILL